MLSPERYSDLLNELNKNYCSIRQKVVESKGARLISDENIADFHKPVASEIRSLSRQLENFEQPLVGNNFIPISAVEDYLPDEIPENKKRKLTEKILKGTVDFDGKLEKTMQEGEDFYLQFGLQRINNFYKNLLDIENENERIEKLKEFCDKANPILLKLSQSLAGKKKPKVVWDKDEIETMLTSPDTSNRDRLILEERLKVLRQQNFVNLYRNSLRVLETNIKNPQIVQVSYGTGCEIFTSLDDMVDKLELLKGNIEGGNNSYHLINEARAICDTLLKHKAINKSQYKKLYSLFSPLR